MVTVDLLEGVEEGVDCVLLIGKRKHVDACGRGRRGTEEIWTRARERETERERAEGGGGWWRE